MQDSGYTKAMFERDCQWFTAVLGALLGWSTERTREWMGRYEEFIGMWPMVHAKRCQLLVDDLILPYAKYNEWLAGRGLRWRDVAGKLQRAITSEGVSIYAISRDDYDWKAARVRIESALNEVGLSLDNLK